MKIKMTWFEGYEPRFNNGDAGIDLRAFIYDDEQLEPGKVTKIPTGVRVEFPEGYFGLILPRSSTGRDGLQLANTAAVVDESFTGEITLFVTSRVPLTIEPKERIAQLVLTPYLQVTELEYGEPRETERGDGGFGSSGKV